MEDSNISNQLILFFASAIIFKCFKLTSRSSSKNSDAAPIHHIIDLFNPNLPIEKASTPPAVWYTSVDIANLENEAVFKRNWHPVGRQDQLNKNGDYISGEILGIPYVIVYKNGTINGFYNTCRHHAAKIVNTPASRNGSSPTGCVSSLMCPYHGWTYSLDGNLINAPKMKGCELNTSDYGLIPIKTGIWGPFVFINFDLNASPVETKWPEVAKRLDCSKLKFHSTRSYTIPCNWKVYVDNYLDGGYHVPVLHQGLTSQLDMSSYIIDCFDDYSIQSCGGKTERIGDQALYAWFYPGFMINRYGPVMDTNYVIPLSHDKTLVVFDFFFDENTESEFIESSIMSSEKVQEEDVLISESVQTGLHSPAYNVGRYSPQLEKSEFQFHKLLYYDLKKYVSEYNNNCGSCDERKIDINKNTFDW